MIDVTLTFNSYDFSNLLSTYTVSHAVETAESVTTMDGEEHVASRFRAIVEFSLIPLSEEQTNEVYAALSGITAEAVYTDPFIGQSVTAQMRVSSDLDAAFALKSVNGKRYYKGEAITLRQRTVL